MQECREAEEIDQRELSVNAYQCYQGGKEIHAASLTDIVRKKSGWKYHT